MIAINPLIYTKDGEFKAANTKVHIDYDAYYRQSEIYSMFDES